MFPPHNSKSIPHPPINDVLPNGKNITSQGSTLINLPHIPAAAATAHVFPSLSHHSLLSVGLLCKHGCKSIFDHKGVEITHHNRLVITGTRNPTTNLYHVDLPDNKSILPNISSSHQCNSLAFLLGSKPRDLILYYHATLFSPTKKTWIKAINKGFFTGWPGLTSKAVNKYLTPQIPTIMGHLKQTRQHLLSTKPTQPKLPKQASQLSQNISPEYNVTSTIYDPTDTSSSDQTGKFPITSSRGNKYIMIFYHHDTNCILAQPMKSRGKSDLTNAFSTLYSLLSSKGYQIKTHFLDNEAPTMLLIFFSTMESNINLFLLTHIGLTKLREPFKLSNHILSQG